VTEKTGEKIFLCVWVIIFIGIFYIGFFGNAKTEKYDNTKTEKYDLLEDHMTQTIIGNPFGTSAFGNPQR